MSVSSVEKSHFGNYNNWFIIEGTIGAGKSTMCRMLQEALEEECEVLFEPVDKWRTTIDDVDGKNILQNFLMKFLNEQGKILPRRLTGTSAKYQNRVNKAIKRARHLAILPYVGDMLK